AAFPWCGGWEDELRALFAAYVEAKQRQNVLDYDDLLLYWAQAMAEPSIAAEIGGRFDHVLVDEYQDTNRLQASILLALKPTGDGVTVVGDDAQSIYAFRAATVRNILDFPAHFRPKATVVTLEQNYRSTQPILAASNAVISLAAERYSKNLWSHREAADKPRIVNVADEVAQVGYIIDNILENREAGVTLKSQAVLFRTSSHSGALEVELTRRNIPFVKFGGLKFLEAAHVKDVLAFLHWAQNPRDRVAGFRVLQLMPGIGPATAARVLDHLAAGELRDFKAPAAAAEAWPDLADTIETVRRGDAGWPAELETICRWYAPHLERAYDDAILREADLAQLTQIAASYQSRERFLTEMKLDPPDATSDEAGPPLLDEDYLILSTIHSAKGQEWKAVFVLNAVDGCIPSDLSVRSAPEIEEERRLLYVAMTRARDQLHLVVPQRFFVHQQRGLGDRHVYAQRTRFIPPALLKLFDVRGWPPAGADRSAAKPAPGSADVRGKLRRMWG
ncbi:MAG: ATP-dependent helicase, partial [Pseudolabrys sp.]